MKITEEMIERVWTAAARGMCGTNAHLRSSLRVALEAVFADYELAPFELTPSGHLAYEKLKRHVSTPEGAAGLKLCDELDRVQRTLVPMRADMFVPTAAEDQALSELRTACDTSSMSAVVRVQPLSTLVIGISRAIGKALPKHAEQCTCRVVGNLHVFTGCALHGEGEPDRAVEDLDEVEPDPDAPKDLSLLQGYWDKRRAREGKSDKSRCGADLQVALAAQVGELQSVTAELLEAENARDYWRKEHAKARALIAAQARRPESDDNETCDVCAEKTGDVLCLCSKCAGNQALRHGELVAVEKLSEEEERFVARMEDPETPESLTLCGIIRRRLPLPAPKPLTAEELRLVLGWHGLTDAQIAAADELVVLAQKAAP